MRRLAGLRSDYERIHPVGCFAGFGADPLQQCLADNVCPLGLEYIAVGLVDLNQPEITNFPIWRKDRFSEGHACLHIVKKAFVALFAQFKSPELSGVVDAAPK